MAEFCLECWNHLNNLNLTEKDVVLSKNLDLCEGCEDLKHIIVRYRSNWFREQYLNWKW